VTVSHFHHPVTCTESHIFEDWLMETYTRDFSACWITGLDAALDFTVIFPDETNW
jgi:hypothetical protein